MRASFTCKLLADNIARYWPSFPIPFSLQTPCFPSRNHNKMLPKCATGWLPEFLSGKWEKTVSLERFSLPLDCVRQSFRSCIFSSPLIIHLAHEFPSHLFYLSFLSDRMWKHLSEENLASPLSAQQKHCIFSLWIPTTFQKIQVLYSIKTLEYPRTNNSNKKL